MLRKCICMIVTVALVVCVSVAPVGAVSSDGRFDVRFFVGGYYYPVSVDLPRSGVKQVATSLTGSSARTYFLSDVSYSLGEVSLSGSLGVYFSWAASADIPGTFNDFPASYRYVYSLANTSSFAGVVESSNFNFSTGVSGQIVSPGQQISIHIDDVDSLTAFSFSPYNSDAPNFIPDGSDSYGFNFYIPSASIVATGSSGELSALESVADQIAEGNEIARAMYGDIMAALNALKGDTSLMASYINDCLTYLSSIETASVGIYNLCASYLHNLASIAQTAEDIELELEAFHTDFMSKLDLLISTITSESDDIQATMDRIYEQLIAWLETNFKEAISPEFEGSNSDLSQGIANNDAIEQQWTGSLSDTWSAMHIADFSFDSSFTSGFMWVSGWFSNIYNSLGLYGSIVILPLIIGICKLLLGYFRFSGHGHSEGGGDVDA